MLGRLVQLKYFDPQVDGCTNSLGFADAVAAFQKVNGLPRTGNVDALVISTLAQAQLPTPLRPEVGPTRLEVDVPHQVMVLYKDNALVRTLHVATGAGVPFTLNGVNYDGWTPAGNHTIDDKVPGDFDDGWGIVHWMMTFDSSGASIHGWDDVPYEEAASHGCVRVRTYISDWLWHAVSAGTPVSVVY